MNNRLANVQMTARSIAQTDEDIAEFRRLLDGTSPEAKIHQFLATHVYWFNGVARHRCPIYSKVKFGAEYEADFAFLELAALASNDIS